MYIAKRKYNTSYDLYMCGNKKKSEWERENEEERNRAEAVNEREKKMKRA